MSQLAIVEAFIDLPDTRRTAGQRHQQALCLALFTLAVTAGNRGFQAIGDWLKAYETELMELFEPAKERLPSYSTIRRTLPGQPHLIFTMLTRQRFRALFSFVANI